MDLVWDQVAFKKNFFFPFPLLSGMIIGIVECNMIFGITSLEEK